MSAILASDLIYSRIATLATREHSHICNVDDVALVRSENFVDIIGNVILYYISGMYVIYLSKRLSHTAFPMPPQVMVSFKVRGQATPNNLINIWTFLQLSPGSCSHRANKTTYHGIKWWLLLRGL